MWPLHLLHERRGEIGSVAFAQEYLNQAVDDLTALFKRHWLEAARQRGKGTPFLYGPAEVVSFGDLFPHQALRSVGHHASVQRVT